MELWPAWIEIGAIFTLGGAMLWFQQARAMGLVLKLAISLAGTCLILTAAWLTFNELGERNAQYAVSPDGSYFARVMVGTGTLDLGDTAVIVRPTGSLRWTRVYRGEGWMAGGGEASPYLEWTNNSHLVIHYLGSVRPAVCVTQVAGIHIECHGHLW